MAAQGRQQSQRNRRSPRKRMVDLVRSALGRGRAMLKRLRLSHRIRGRGAGGLGRLGREMAGAIRTVPGIRQPGSRARRGRPAAQGEATRDARRRSRQGKERQAKPGQVARGQDLERQTVRQLRQQARKAGIEGRSSMTKDQLIKALRDHR